MISARKEACKIKNCASNKLAKILGPFEYLFVGNFVHAEAINWFGQYCETRRQPRLCIFNSFAARWHDWAASVIFNGSGVGRHVTPDVRSTHPTHVLHDSLRRFPSFILRSGRLLLQLMAPQLFCQAFMSLHMDSTWICFQNKTLIQPNRVPQSYLLFCQRQI